MSKAQMAIMMLKMRAVSMTEVEAIDEVINALQVYKSQDCPKEDKPMIEVHTLMMKFSGKSFAETTTQAGEFQEALDVMKERKDFTGKVKPGI